MNEQTSSRTEQEQAIAAFLRDYLDQPKDEQTLQKILAEIGAYYGADRACIFELNEARTHVRSSCNWCRAELPDGGGFGELPVSEFGFLFPKLEETGALCVVAAAEAQGCGLLGHCGIGNLMAMPILVDGELIGFLGVGNPRRNTGDDLLLSVVVAACRSESAAQRLLGFDRARAGREMVDRA